MTVKWPAVNRLPVVGSAVYRLAAVGLAVDGSAVDSGALVSVAGNR